MEFESAQAERTDLPNDDNHSDKTGSEGSEGFVKVDPLLDEAEHSTAPTMEATKVYPQVETIPAPSAGVEKKNHLESALYDRLNARVVDLMFWRDVRWSGAVFFFSLLILISMRCFSFISVVSYSALALLSVTMAFRIYKFVLQTINGTQQPNPFQTLLDADLTISQKQWQCYADATLVHVNNLITCTRGLLLISSVTSSIKFGLLMWLMTYVGEWFDLLTLLTIDLVFAFTLPPIYEKYQQPIDAYYGMAISKVREVIILVKSKIPGPKQKKQ